MVIKIFNEHYAIDSSIFRYVTTVLIHGRLLFNYVKCFRIFLIHKFICDLNKDKNSIFSTVEVST